MSLQQQIKEKREQYGKIVTDQTAIINKAKEEKRELTKAEDEQYERMDNEYLRLEKDIERLETLEKRQKQNADEIFKQAKEKGVSTDEKLDGNQKHERAFRNWMRDGFNALNGEDRSIMLNNQVKDGEKRAQSTTTTAGGYLIPTGFSKQLETALLMYGGMLGVSMVIETDTGNTINWPTDNDTSNEGALLAENTADTEQDITFGNISIGAYKYTSKIVRVSNEVMQDSFFPFDTVIGDKLGERLGRILNRHATTGTGTNQPNGVVTASTSSGASSVAAAAITATNIYDLKHSVDPAYRTNARFMFNDSTLKAIKKLSIGSSDDRPLWQASFMAGEPPTIDGDPYTINQHMASIGASAKSMLYGNFKKYLIRRVKPITMIELKERYAEYHQTGFIGFLRFDSELLDAGTHPIKHLLHAAS